MSEREGMRFKTTSIKGKEYVEVSQRVLAFWQLYPNGRIETDRLDDDGERCDFVARVYDGERLLAVGHAFEERKSNWVNKTSYVENCETSAVGRALGFLGIGCDASIASADEVASAIGAREGSREATESRAELDWSRLAPIAEDLSKKAYGGDWEAHLRSVKSQLLAQVADAGGCADQASLDAAIDAIKADVDAMGVGIA